MSIYREAEETRRPASARRPYRNADFEDATDEIVSFPASVQSKLDRAQALLRHDRPSEAHAALQQAGAELARTAPELFALMVASQMGARSLTFEDTQMDTRTVRTDRYAFGIRYGHDETTTTDVRTRRRSIGLG